MNAEGDEDEEEEERRWRRWKEASRAENPKKLVPTKKVGGEKDSSTEFVDSNFPCPKCGCRRTAVVWRAQTRSADEGQTVRMTCERNRCLWTLS